MKTVKTLSVAILVSASVLFASASDFSLKKASVVTVSDNKLNLEPWMLDLGLFSTKDADSQGSSVVEIAIANPDFSILVEAVTKADLVEALSAKGPFTVFAPNNEAFNNLFSKLGVSGIKDLSAEQLKSILLYHVVSGKVMSTDLTNTKVATLNGQELIIDLSDGVKINESTVIVADISGNNGVIHVIDEVLIPQ